MDRLTWKGVVAVLAVLFVIGFAVGLALSFYTPLGDRIWGAGQGGGSETAAGDEPDVPGQAPPTTPSGSVVRIGPETEIVYKIAYDRCGCVDEQSSKATDSMIGLGLEEMRIANPDFAVISFTPELVVFAQTSPGYCREHDEHRFVTIHEGEVCIYRGWPGDHDGSLQLELKQRTGILARDLKPQDVDRLTTGIKVGSDMEAWELLEGLGE